MHEATLPRRACQGELQTQPLPFRKGLIFLLAEALTFLFPSSHSLSPSLFFIERIPGHELAPVHLFSRGGTTQFHCIMTIEDVRIRDQCGGAAKTLDEHV